MNHSRPQLLCIDENTATAKWIAEKLHQANLRCDITSVLTGREGFRQLMSRSYDLCVLEYALPDMSGVQLCALTKQVGSGVPMLFFTPLDRPIDRENANAAGAAGYLIKPDELDLFVDTATHLLKRRQIYAVPRRPLEIAQAA